MRITAIAFAALLVTGSSNAQTSVPVPTEILIPVAVSGAGGHYGTRWNTEMESTDPDGAGVAIPVAFADDMRTAFSIPGIPTDVRYRALLRVYTRAARVAVRTYDAETGTLLDARSRTRPTITDADNFASVNFHDLLSVPRIRAVERVRVEAECSGPSWGMLTLTDNATQGASVYAPSFHRYPSP